MTILGIIGGLEVIIILVAAVFALLLPLLALIDIVKSQFQDNNKIVWVLIVLFLPYLGSIVYFIIGQKQKIGRY